MFSYNAVPYAGDGMDCGDAEILHMPACCTTILHAPFNTQSVCTSTPPAMHTSVMDLVVLVCAGEVRKSA